MIGAVTSDHPELAQAIERVAEDVPVFGLVNELHSDALSGRIGVNWQDMGYVIGRHLSELHPKGTPSKSAVFITGPRIAGWTGPLEAGLRDGLTDSAITISGVYEDDTGLRQQLALVETALEQYPETDFLIGSAPAVEAASGLIAAQKSPQAPQLLSTYISHTVLRGLMNGGVFAASFDDPIAQGVMAIRQAVLTIGPDSVEKSIGPEVVLLKKGDGSVQRVMISPADYFPAIE